MLHDLANVVCAAHCAHLCCVLCALLFFRYMLFVAEESKSSSPLHARGLEELEEEGARTGSDGDEVVMVGEQEAEGALTSKWQLCVM